MYTFTEDCRLGIEEIDKEHEELFRLINEAQELLDQKRLWPISWTIWDATPESILPTKRLIWNL